MGKTSKSGLGIGTGSSPQGSLSQENVDTKVKELAKKHMIDQLIKAGVKFKPEDVIFVTKDKTGQLVWLEKGNSSAGLEHIKKHAGHFLEKHGIKPESLNVHMYNILTKGEVVFSNQKNLVNGRVGLEKIYLYNGKYYTLVAVGTNGFVVSMYPLGGKK